MSSLKLFLFGSPRLEQSGEALSLGRRKALALLAYVALTRQPHSRDTLTAFFWPESDHATARSNLRRELSQIRRKIKEPILASDRLEVWLNPAAPLWLDINQFQTSLDQVEQHDHESGELCSDCASNLAEAMDLYSGEFMAGFNLPDSPAFDEWQYFQRESLHRSLATSLSKLIQWHSQQGDYELGIEYGRRWLALDPLHEPAQRQLMKLYAWAGQPAAALNLYEESVKVLEEELGVPPEEDTSALIDLIKTRKLEPPEGAIVSKETIPLKQSAQTPLPPPQFVQEISQEQPSVPFVAREEELAQLQQHLDKVLANQGQIMFVTGEAGSGKTTIVQEFCRQAQAASEEVVYALGHCNAYTGRGDPYAPFREILSLLTGDIEPGLSRGKVTRENASRLWDLHSNAIGTLLSVGSGLVDTFVSKAGLENRAGTLGLSLPGETSGSETQQDLFEQYTRLLQTVAKERPLLLVIEDMHWADDSSINLLFHLSRQLAGSRILFLITYRPDDIALGRDGARHPLEPIVHEITRSYGNVKVELAAATGKQFVDALLATEPNRLSEQFARTLCQRTQGHPLFTVELLREMQTRGDLVQDEEGIWREGPDLNWEKLPARVEAVIKERIERLTPSLRDILTVASVEGEAFTTQVVAHIQETDERQLLRQLSHELDERQHLVKEEGEIQVGQRYLSRFRFSHFLFQQYLYNNLRVGERRLLHGKVGQALEILFGVQDEEIIPQLAHHFAEAGQSEKAADYLLQAGDKARNLYSYPEAIDFYRKAIPLLKEQEAYDRAARTWMKLGLTYHLIFDFKQAQQAYDEGFALWQQVEPIPLDTASLAPHVLRFYWDGSITLDPMGTTDNFMMINQLFSGLIEQRPNMELVPDVARSWQVIDGREYIFQLRDDIVWSDGVPVTAHDFIYAWQRSLAPTERLSTANWFYDVKGARAFHRGEFSDPDLVGIKALDDFTLFVELEQPVSYFLLLLTRNAWFPVPRHVVKKYGKAWTEVQNIVTNGPFKLHTYQPGQIMVLERNSAYRGVVTGNVQQIELKLSPIDANTAYANYKEGDIDFLGHRAHLLKHQHPDEYITVSAFITNYLAFDCSRPPFNDVRIRQAFVLAVDKEKLAPIIQINGHVPANGGLLPPGMPGYSPGIGLSFDSERARQLLAEAGFAEGRGFPEIDWYIFHDHDHELFMDNFQSQWRENLGLELKWQGVEDRRLTTFGSDYTPHLSTRTWWAEYPDPDDFLRKNTFRNLIHWQNKAFEELIREARFTVDQEKRIRLYQQAERMIVEEATIILPYRYIRFHILVKPWVRRFPMSPINWHYFKDVIMDPH